MPKFEVTLDKPLGAGGPHTIVVEAQHLMTGEHWVTFSERITGSPSEGLGHVAAFPTPQVLGIKRIEA